MGSAVHEAAAGEALAVQGIDAEVINFSSIRPLDRTNLVASLRKTGMALTVEEHGLHGGVSRIGITNRRTLTAPPCAKPSYGSSNAPRPSANASGGPASKRRCGPGPASLSTPISQSPSTHGIITTICRAAGSRIDYALIGGQKGVLHLSLMCWVCALLYRKNRSKSNRTAMPIFSAVYDFLI